MSYLDLPRLTFAGQFQADVSTVNNDPRHFDNATFEPHFQEFQTKDTQNGWWNPIGTGIFRLSGCRIQAALGPPSNRVDPVVGYVVGNSPDRPSAKIVDLDPDWQLASGLYGLEISLSDPDTGALALVAEFDVAAFRDLWFTRGGGTGDAGASAMWQSQLSKLRWASQLDSPVLQLLAERSAASGALSIRIATFTYQTSTSQPSFTYGTLIGAIGPVRAGEPKTFIAGRRFMPNGANPYKKGSCTSANGMTCFSAKIIDGALVADLGNALPLDDRGIPALPGGATAQLALLRRPNITEATTVTTEDYIPLGALDVSMDALVQQSGIQRFAIPEALRAEVTRLPFAIIQPGTQGASTVMMREQPDGRDVRVDDVSFRLDPNAAESNARLVPIYATRYGEPLAGAIITFQAGPPTPDVSDAPTDKTPGTTPTAPIPMINTPIGVPRVEPLMSRTDEAGRAQVRIAAPSTMGHPRSYIDGQVYALAYNFADGPAAIMQTFDQVSVLIFSSYAAPVAPTWAQVQPILKQYANLYPIMSKGLFDFSIQDIADANAHLLHFVMSKPIDDPDYMPVTRDLSAGKRATLLRYFAGVMAKSAIHRPDTVARYAGRCPFSGVAPSKPPEDVPNKIIFQNLRSK